MFMEPKMQTMIPANKQLGSFAWGAEKCEETPMRKAI